MAFEKTSIIIAAEDRTRAAFESVKANVAGLNGSITKLSGLLGGLGVALSGAGFVGMVKGLIDSAEGLNDLATRTGTSVESLASLQLAAKQADTDLEGLGKGLGKLSVFMGQNADEAAALGITARDPVQAFAQLADVISATADPAERNALAMSVLGKSYADLMPLLAQGGDSLRQQAEDSAGYAERMGKLAESAGRFNDALDELALTGQAALLPIAQAFTDMAGAALDAAEGMEGFDKVLAGLGQAGTVGQTIGVLWANVAYVFKGVGTEIGGIAAQLAAIASGDFQGAGAISDAMKADAEAARAELDKLEDRILNFKPTPKAKTSGKKAAPAGLNLSDFINPGETDKIQAQLRKAFDLKPLDDFIAGFSKRRQDVEREYDRLVNKLTAKPLDLENVKGFEIGGEVAAGQGALARGDAVATEAAVDRARQMLEALKAGGGLDAEVRYYADQIKRLDLALLDSQQNTAESTRAALLANLNTAAEEVAKMDPLKIPLASEAIANDLKATIEQVRRDLDANPIQIPVVVTDPRGVYGPDGQGSTASDLRTAALQTGGRR